MKEEENNQINLEALQPTGGPEGDIEEYKFKLEQWSSKFTVRLRKLERQNRFIQYKLEIEEVTGDTLDAFTAARDAIKIESSLLQSMVLRLKTQLQLEKRGLLDGEQSWQEIDESLKQIKLAYTKTNSLSVIAGRKELTDEQDEYPVNVREVFDRMKKKLRPNSDLSDRGGGQTS